MKPERIIENRTRSLLLLDLQLPGMDGLETMRLVHQQQPLIPIIVISGNPVTSDSGSGPARLMFAIERDLGPVGVVRDHAVVVDGD